MQVYAHQVLLLHDPNRHNDTDLVFTRILARLVYPVCNWPNQARNQEISQRGSIEGCCIYECYSENSNFPKIDVLYMVKGKFS